MKNLTKKIAIFAFAVLLGISVFAGLPTSTKLSPLSPAKAHAQVLGGGFGGFGRIMPFRQNFMPFNRFDFDDLFFFNRFRPFFINTFRPFFFDFDDFRFRPFRFDFDDFHRWW